MQLTNISIASVLGIARADIHITAPILMVSGRNEAGKSTLADAVSMALTGAPRRVKLKKDLAKLINGDAKKGRISLSDGETLVGQYLLPKGEHEVEALPGADFLPYVLSPDLFARLDDSERRSLLFKLTRCKVSPDTTEKELIDAGVLPAIAAELKPLLRSGFPAACKEAKERATQAKGAWRATTGENWGSDKAEGWEPELPVSEVSQDDIAQAGVDLQAITEELNEALESIGAAKQARRAETERVTKIAELQEAAALTERRKTKLAGDESALAEWSAKLKEAQALAAGEVAAPSHDCPHCAGKLEIKNGKVIAHVAPDHQPDPEAARRVPEYKGYVESAERAVNNSKRDLDASLSAVAQIEALQVSGPAPTEEAIANGEAVISEFRQARDRAQAKLSALQEAASAIASRAQTIHTAAMYHSEVNAWLLAADELSPEGIPARTLKKAIGPVNDTLAILARLSGWKTVAIGDDMAILIDGREYGLCSESAKWRADTMLALAVAQIAEIRFAMLDRFDVLDMPGRKQLLGMLLELADIKAMDLVIMCGTLKEVPRGLPPAIQSVWIENGIAE